MVLPAKGNYVMSRIVGELVGVYTAKHTFKVCACPAVADGGCEELSSVMAGGLEQQSFMVSVLLNWQGNALDLCTSKTYGGSKQSRC